MNLVGEHGKGESVWLGFFLYDVLTSSPTLASARGDMAFAERCQSEAAQLRQNIEQQRLGRRVVSPRLLRRRHAARFASNAECQIDSISQSWSVLSGAGDPSARAWPWKRWTSAWSAATHGLIQLLDPPFDTSALESRLHQGLRARACAKTAGSTPMPRSGRRWPSPAWATTERAWELFAMINPVNHANAAAKQAAIYKVEPYVVAADVYARRRRIPAAAAGPGTPARPAGCIG